jgi:hypothetical protein
MEKERRDGALTDISLLSQPLISTAETAENSESEIT